MLTPPKDLIQPPDDLIEGDGPPSDLIQPPSDLIQPEESGGGFIDQALSVLAHIPKVKHDIEQAFTGVARDAVKGFVATPIAAAGTAVDMALNATTKHLGNPTQPGMSAGERFTDEFQALMGTSDDLIPGKPKTDRDADIQGVLGNIFHTIITGAGDIFASVQEKYPGAISTTPGGYLYTANKPLSERPDVSVAGAIGQVAATIATFGIGAKKPSRPVMTGDPIVDFTTRYPKTVARLEASRVGKFSLTEAQQAADPKTYFGTIVTKAVDGELGITQAMKDAEPAIASMTTGDKLKILVQRKAAESGEVLSPKMIDGYVNRLVDQIFEVQTHIDRIQQKPGLPRPYVLDDPITVDPKGVAVTGEQWVKYMEDLQAATPENRATMLGIGPMGVVNRKLIEYNRLKAEADRTGRPSDQANVRKAMNDLKQNWAGAFSNPKDTYARTKALEEYIARDGKMSWNEAAQLVGPRRQKGVLDIEGLEANVQQLKHLGEGVTKYAALGLITPSGLGKDPVQMYRGTRTGQDVTLQPGAWLSDSIDNAGKDYGTSSIITPHSVPAEHLVKVQPGGYIYAPPGTKLGSLARFKDPEGDIVTFDDLAGSKNVIGGSKVFGKKIQQDTKAAAEKFRSDVMDSTDWKFNVGDRVRSRGDNELYEVSDRSIDPKTSKPQYTLKGVSASNSGGLFKADIVHNTFEKMSGPTGAIPGGKQRGILDIEGLEKNIPQAKEAAKNIATKGWALQNPEAAANRVKEVYQKNAMAMEQGRSALASDMVKKARRLTYAHDYDLRANLQKAGTYGEQAYHRLVVQAGATMAGKVRVDRINEAIFDKMNHAERGWLDELTRLRRIIQIDKYKGVNTVRHEGGITGPMALARVTQMQKELGPTFSKIDEAATSIFESQRQILDRLVESGLETQELRQKLYNLDYTRTEYLDLIDPLIPISSRVRNLPTSIRSSGIAELGRGKNAFVNTDAQLLLNEDVIRVENRIFKNNTLQALKQLAIEKPENDIVKVPTKAIIKVDKNGDQSIRHTPEGYTAIGVRVNGKQEFLLMRDDFAEQFVARPEGMPEWMAITFRWGFGVTPIKTTTTSYNPSFIIAGLPMDIFHTWFAGRNVYSGHLPKYLMQMGADLAATAKDAFMHKGEWEQAMSEGLGSSFLSHESRGLTDPSKTLRGQLSPRLARVKSVLAYLGESTDMWTRLAYRRRLITSGMDSVSATAEARARLDYYQGGQLAKALDNIIPWTNVAIQGTGRVLEAAAKDPKRAAVQASWVVGTAAAVKLATMVASPETDKQMATRDKVRNWNITFGDQYFIFDANGNKRYAYIPIRLDQTAMPLNAAVVGGLELSEYGKVPHDIASTAVGQVVPISKSIPIPTIDAIATYMQNYDSFTDSPIYSGPKVKPEDEVRSFGSGRETSPIFNTLGQLTSGSPMRLEAAFGKLVNTNNAWIQLMGGSNKLLFAGANPREQAQMTLTIMQGTPMLSSLVKFTVPGISEMIELEEAEQDAGSKYAPIYRKLNDIVFQMENKQNGVTQKTLETFINSQPPEYRKKLFDHAKYTVTVDRIMDKFKASDEMPPKAWWVASAKADPSARGQVFYNEWVSASPKGRAKMMSVANALHSKGLGYMSDDFKRSFMQEKQMFGEDER